jgi:serine/threonine-protein kinase
MTTTSDTDATRAMSEDAVATVALERAGRAAARQRRSRKGLGLGAQISLHAAWLLIVTLGLTIAIASWRSAQVAEETIQADLARVPDVWAGYASTRQNSAVEQVRSLAREPGTLAIFAEEVDFSTRLSFAQEDAQQMLLGAGTVFLFDRYSALLAQSSHPDGPEVGTFFGSVGWVAEVLDTRQATHAFIRERDALSIVAAAPVIAGEGPAAQLQGVLAVTFPLTEASASDLQSLTRGEVAVVVDMARRGQEPEIALSHATEGLDGTALAAAVAEQPQAVERLISERRVYGPTSVLLAGEQRDLLAVPISNFDGEVLGAVLVTRSRAEEMASFFAIRRALLVAGLLMLLLSLPASFLLGKRITGPVRELAAGAEAIRDGRLDVELPATGQGEVGVLAGAFSAMVEDLKEKDALEQLLADMRARSADTGDAADRTRPAVTTTSPSDQSLPSLGDVFGTRYRIRSELGRGGMGVVYRATDLELEEDVALKVLRPGAFEDATDGLAKLKREVRLARRISHSNVIRVHDLVEADGRRCLSMEFVPGTTLLRVLKEHGKLGLAPGLQVAKQLCRGLAAVHDEGIVHRDLKPQNVMVLPNGVVKLMDFGISHGGPVSEDVQKKVVEGTPAYMSPEQCRGEELDHASDLYSLGVVLWEMFAGSIPFQATTVASMMQQQLNATPPPLRSKRDDMPSDLEEIIMTCLAKERGHRPPSAKTVYLLLREVLVTEW